MSKPRVIWSDSYGGGKPATRDLVSTDDGLVNRCHVCGWSSEPTFAFGSQTHEALRVGDRHASLHVKAEGA